MKSTETFTRQAVKRFEEAREFWGNWRAQARDDFAFVSGDQWQQEDAQKLETEGRPPITFNYSEKMIDAVVGAEVSNRHEATYLPRGVEDAGAVELWNAAAKWVRQECNAEDEDSDAFRDALICGLGWTWTHLSYETDLEGKIVVERIDPLEMWPDPAASRLGLADRRWQDREWWVDDEEVQRTWPKALIGSPGYGDEHTGSTITRGNRYSDEDMSERDRHKGQTKIRLHECFELEPIYKVSSGNEVIELSPVDFKQLNDAMPLPKGSYVKMRKRVYYRAFFAGDTLLEYAKSPCQEGYTFNCITAKRDRNRNTWYGLTKVMKDPARWANKWLSQVIHIINSNAKGGLLAETGAFVDPRRAQQEWSSPDSITLLREGGIDKIKEKQVTPYPAGLDKLMQFALGSLPMVTGINLEALGLANREQAGVLEEQRKQAAYGLLAPVFDALRRYRKEHGRVLLYFIHTYISDGRLIRIGGPESQQYLPLVKQKDAPRYDVIVEQAPTSPDSQQKTWQTLVEIIPAMLKAGIPLPPDLLDYTPLPVGLKTKWKEFIGQQQQVDAEAQEEMQKLQEENEALKRDQAIKLEELEMDRQLQEAKFAMEKRKMEQDMELQRLKLQTEMQMEQWKMQREYEQEQHRLQQETRLREQTAEQDFKLKAFTAGMTEGDMSKRISFGVETSGLAKMLEEATARQEQMISQMAQAVQMLAEQVVKPKRMRLITDAAGRPVGSETVQ